MDKESNEKGKSNVSPTLLTPCRPVGLRRKRSIAKNTSSPLVNIPDAAGISSPTTPVNTISLKTQILTDHIAPADNEQENIRGSGVKSDLKSLESEDRKNLKRKPTTPYGSNILRRKISLKPTSNSPAKLRQEALCGEVKKMAVDKIEENDNNLIVVSGDSYMLQRSATLTSANISDESTVKRKSTTTEINALKDRIASKEKQLREQKLAALYKKKHDPKQVANEIDKWLRGCKEALSDLQAELTKRGQSYSLIQLLSSLRIPPSLIDIDEENSE